MRRLAALGALLALAGCGGSAEPIVNPEGDGPLLSSLEVEPETGDLVVTTNRGLFRIPQGGEPQAVRGTLTLNGRREPVGRRMEVLPLAPGELLGSGHPDRKQAPFESLGLLRSSDGGKTWKVISQLGHADLHRMVVKHSRLYAYDAVSGSLLISADGGRTFDEAVTPLEPMVDLAVDPGDPDRVLLASDRTIYRSRDGGRHWRPLGRAADTRLAWPEDDALYRADRKGVVSVSANAGARFRRVGRVDGAPTRLEAVDGRHLYVALADGSIRETRDGGKDWKTVYPG